MKRAALLLVLLWLAVCTARAEEGWSGGLRGGALLASTELEDGPGPQASAFLRTRLSPRWSVEVHFGYGRFSGADYATDLSLGGARLLLDIRPGPSWKPHLFAGAGLLRYNVDETPPQYTADARAIGWSVTLPAGLGLRRALQPGLDLEMGMSYTYTLRDDLNRAIVKKGNDAFWGLELNLVWSRPPAAPARPLFPVPAGDLQRDRDGDGLSDRDEMRLYFTNPLLPDSDGDGLSDRDEIERGTHPNRLDSDGGGVWDGVEVEREGDPLDPADD